MTNMYLYFRKEFFGCMYIWSALNIRFRAYLYGEVCRIKGSSSYEPRFSRTGVFRDKLSGSLHQKLAVFLRRHYK